jgi:mRNA degradation ribonuclease J1/J2
MLARNGIIEVSAVADSSLSRLLADPKIQVRGVNVNAKRVMEVFKSSFREIIRMQRKTNLNEESLAEELRIAVRRDLETDVGYKTVVSVFLHRL